MSKAVLIISGYNYRAVIAFCRFAVRSGIKIHIVTKNSEDYIYLSAYKKHVISQREKNELNIKDFYNWKLKISEENVIILPSTEYLNRFILKHRNELNLVGYTTPLCNDNLYKVISDKYSFSEICIREGINVPYELSTDNIENSKFPIVAKPKEYNSKSGFQLKPIILHTEQDYKNFLLNYSQNDFYFQKYISGKSIYLLYYFPNRQRSYSAYSQENLIQQDEGLSIIASISSDYHSLPVSQSFIALFNELGFTGLIMVEVKYFENEYYMIEANPRLWGPSQLILDANMDIFYKFASDYELVNEIPEMNYQVNKKYFWSGGIYSDSLNSKKIKFHDYSLDEYISAYKEFIDADVYFKRDTLKIFKKELGHGTNL